jgi:hypothetical protein
VCATHPPWYTGRAVSRFEHSHDPDRPGHLLLQGGEPVAMVYWAHDFADRAQTGWFLVLLDDGGEPDPRPARRLKVGDAVTHLIGDAGSDREAWLARAETVELLTATDAIAAGERELEQVLGGQGG